MQGKVETSTPIGQSNEFITMKMTGLGHRFVWAEDGKKSAGCKSSSKMAAVSDSEPRIL